MCVRINESNVITLYRNRCIDNLKLYFFFFFHFFIFFFFKHAFIVHVTCLLSLGWIKMENFIISCFYAEVKSLVSWLRTILKIEAWSRDGLECLVVADLPPSPIDCIVCSTWSEQGSRIEYIIISVINNDTIMINKAVVKRSSEGKIFVSFSLIFVKLYDMKLTFDRFLIQFE